MNTSLIICLFLAALFVLRTPIAFAVLAAGAAGLYLVAGEQAVMGALANSPYDHVTSFTLTTVPMFVLMAELLTAGGFTRDLFALSRRLLDRFRGGVLYAVLFGGVLLGAISGSSTAAAGSLARASFPHLRRYGISESLAGATSAVTGTLAIMIPPSLGLILFGVFTETSVARLLVAGLVPGLLTAAGYLVALNWAARRDRKQAPQIPQGETDEEPVAFRAAIPVLMLIAAVMFALYSGIVTVTEAGAVGAALAFVLCIALGRTSLRELVMAFVRATRISAMILSIIIFSSIFATFLILGGVTQDILGAVTALDLNRWAILGIVLLIVLVLGFFLDQLAILLITLPFSFPLLTGLGFDPIWLGIVYAKCAEIGMVSPPFGLNVFVVSGATKVPAETIFRGIWPFVICDVAVLMAMLALPAIATGLPTLLFAS